MYNRIGDPFEAPPEYRELVVMHCDYKDLIAKGDYRAASDKLREIEARSVEIGGSTGQDPGNLETRAWMEAKFVGFEFDPLEPEDFR